MPLSEQYQDDAVGGVNLGPHASGSFGNMLGGLTSNHAAFVLIVVGLIGLWVIAKVMKGA